MPKNRGRVLCLLLLILSLIMISLPQAAEAAPTESDKAAVVNGTVIKKADFEREMSRVQNRLVSMGRNMGEFNMSEIKTEVLESLINRELLSQESRKKGITISDADVDAQVKKVRDRFKSEDEFKQALNKMNFSESDLKSQIKDEMVFQRFIDSQFVENVSVSEKEAKDYYDSHLNLFKQPEQVRASHILIKVDPKADKSEKEKAMQKTQTIQEKLAKGEKFSVLAEQFSDCPSKAKGGDLGFFGRGQMVQPFEKAAFSLKKGETSDIVETAFGYHIITVTDKKPETTTAFNDVQDKIQQYLKQEKVQKEIMIYVEKLKKNAKIERYVDTATK